MAARHGPNRQRLRSIFLGKINIIERDGNIIIPFGNVGSPGGILVEFDQEGEHRALSTFGPAPTTKKDRHDRQDLHDRILRLIRESI